MKKLLCIVNLWISLLAIARGENTLLIRGMVQDVASDLPIVGATLLLVDVDSTFVLGTVTDDLGHFEIKTNAIQEGFLMVSYIGYQDTTVRVASEEANPIIIPLTTRHFRLTEITVEGKKPLLEQKNDRLVMNLSASHSTNGSSALQLLQRVPGVVVDQQNGQISITGKNGVLVMINDRLVRVPIQMLMNQLEAMKADNVERIEVIHQPPARFEASGAGGIIHLVVKKNENLGLNGNSSVSVGYGQLAKLGGNLSLNFRRERVNLYGEYNFSLNENDQYYFVNQREYTSGLQEFSYVNRSDMTFQQKKLHAARIGLDFQVSEKMTLGLLTGMGDFVHRATLTSRSTSQIDQIIRNESEYYLRPHIFNQYYFINANMLRKSGNRTINFDIDYAEYLLSSPGTFHLRSSAKEALPTEIRVDRNTPLTLWTLKGDVTEFFSDGHKLELGAKISLSQLDNQAIIEQLNDEGWEEIPLFSNRDLIKEDIYAAYLSFVPKTEGRTSFETGLRYEYYDYVVDSESEDRNFLQQRGSLFPVIRFNFEFDSINNLQLAYNRRISRPAYSQLASYFVFLDPTLVGSGNPLLRPAFIQSLKLSFIHKSIYFALEATRTKNYITHRNTVDKERHLQTSLQHNYDQFNITSATISLPIHLTSWWDLNLTAIGQWRTVKDTRDRAVPIHINHGNLIVQSAHSFRINSSLSADLQVNTYRNVLDGDQIKADMINVNIGLQKKFRSGSTLSLAVNDLLNAGLRIPWEYHQPEISIRTWGLTQVSERQVRLTYSFNFGNKKVTRYRHRKTGSDEERNRVKN